MSDLNLTTKMLKDFVEALVIKPETPTESTCYGTYHLDDEYSYVIFDGAEEQTPCVPLITCADGDRVTVTIRENTCYITGVM